MSTAITPVANVYYAEEAAGKIGAVLGVIASVVMPFAAPAIWGALAGSGGILAGLGTAMTGAFGAGLSGVIGSAAVGAVMNAGIAYASGAPAGAVWKAAGMGAIQGGGGAFARGTGVAAAAKPGAAGLNLGTIGKVSTNVFGQTVNAAGQTVAQTAGTIASTTPAVSGSIMGTIKNIFSGDGINRIGAALVNAIVNGQSQQDVDALVAQQRAALQSLNAQEQAAYAQRMQAAQQILANADRNNPEWLSRIRMADVAGVMNREHDQAMRNIAAGQGTPFNAGQRKYYERSGRLAIGRAKAGAAATGYRDGVALQREGYAQAAGLMTGPSFAGWEAGLNLETAAVNARNANRQSTAAGFTQGIFGTNYGPAPSGDPSEEDNGNDQAGIFAGWRG